MEVDINLADICGLTLQNKPLSITTGGVNSVFFISHSDILNVTAVAVVNMEVQFSYIKS